jgi:hypothetical protein
MGNIEIKNYVMRKSALVFIVTLCIGVFSCTENDPNREIIEEYSYKLEYDGKGYILYKMKLPKEHFAYSRSNGYRKYYLDNEYILIMDSDIKGNLNNLYFYDWINGIKYTFYNVETFENNIKKIIPQNTLIRYYNFCTTGSGIKNESNVLIDLNNILEKHNIIFAFYDESEYSGFYRNREYNPKLIRRGICRCLGG